MVDNARIGILFYKSGFISFFLINKLDLFVLCLLIVDIKYFFVFFFRKYVNLNETSFHYYILQSNFILHLCLLIFKVNKNYYFSNIEKNYADARSYCHQIGSDLVTVENSFGNNFIYKKSK